MQQLAKSNQELYQAGLAALQRGEPDRACEFLTRLVNQGEQNTSVWTALALSLYNLNKVEEALEAIGHALTLEPGNITGHILQGDWLYKSGQHTRANQAYGLAEEIAAQSETLPADIQREVSRIRNIREQINGQIARHLKQSLSKAGFNKDNYTRRFKHAMSLLNGEKQIYHQRPRAFYFPELPNIQFYDTSQFAWREKLEAATPEIREEVARVLADNIGLQPYIHSREQGKAAKYNPLLDDTDWSAFFLIKNGQFIEENVRQCPATMKALEGVPFPNVNGRDPMALFSVLRPGTRIAPHHGFLNTRLICHLPLIVPDNCGIRVGNDTRQWEEGKVMVFDDSIEHEAWNNSDKTRAVLIFDIWRPELTEIERQQIRQLLESLDDVFEE